MARNLDDLLHIIVELNSDDANVRARAESRARSIAVGRDADKVLPLLATLLVHTDRKVRLQAAMIIGWTGPLGQGLVGELRERLVDSDEDDSVRVTCAWTLADMGFNGVRIVADAAKVCDASGREIAVKVLGDIGRKELSAVTALVAALGDPEDKVWSLAQNRLAQIGDLASSALAKALEDPDLRVQVRAAAVLINRSPFCQPAVRAAVRCLKHEDPVVRSEAACALFRDAGCHEEVNVRDYIDLLRDQNCHVRSFAAIALRNIGPPESNRALPALASALNDSDPDVRVFAMQALGDLGSSASGAVPVLVDQLRHFPKVAAEALAKIGPVAYSALPALRTLEESLRPRWEELQKEKLVNPDLDEDEHAIEIEESVAKVIHAIEVIEGRRPVPARSVYLARATIPELVNALQSSDPMMVAAASGYLVRRGTAATPALAALLTDRDKDHRANALSALRELGPQAADAIYQIVAGFADRDFYSGCSTMRDLFIMTAVAVGEAAIPALREAGKSRDALVRDGAMKALREIESIKR